MSLYDELKSQMKTAMKAGDKQRLSVVRMLISAINYVGIDEELNDEVVLQVLQKEAKKRREAIEAYSKAGREEQAKQEEYELSVIEEYLPKMMTTEEVEAKARELLADFEGNNMGQAIGLVMRELKGKAEGGIVAKVVKNVLSK